MFYLNIVGTEKVYSVDSRKTIGRLSEPQVSIQLLDVTVSKRHCTVEAVLDQYILVRDLGSLNGTFVNGKKVVGEAKVYVGQEIRIGGFRLHVQERAVESDEDIFEALTPVRTYFRSVAPALQVPHK